MIEPLEYAVYSVSIFFSVINFVFLTCQCVVQVRERKRFHLNYVLLRTHYFFACFGVSFGHLAISCLVLDQRKSSFVHDVNYNTWWYLHFLKAYCVNLLRVTLISFVVERSIATTLRRSYEKSCKFLLVPLGLSLVCYSVAFALTGLSTLWNVDMKIVYSIYMGIDVVHWLSASLLSRYNIRLFRKGLEECSTLSQRYQINENIRVFMLILPISRTGCLFTFLASVVAVVVYLLKFDPKYSEPVYYMIVNVFITVAFFVSMKCQGITPTILCKILCCRENYRADTAVSPRKVTNVLGENIINSHQGDLHFQYMQDSWQSTLDLKNSKTDLRKNSTLRRDSPPGPCTPPSPPTRPCS